MPVEQPGRISQWVEALRLWLPSARQRGGEWLAAVREEPVLIWRTPAVRFGVYGLALLLGVLTVRWATGLISPGGPEVQPPARTASFHVICSNPACRHEFVISRKFGFSSFPSECPKCKQETGRRAVQCFSKTCNGRWTYAAVVNGQNVCAYCREPLTGP